LEGNKLTIDDTENIIKGFEVKTARVRDVKEIINYRNAIGKVSGDTEKVFTIGFIFSIHKILGQGALPDKMLGAFRKKNAVIISSQSGEVVFDPPPASDIASEMDELLEWENSSLESIHPLLKAGIIHYELVRIHPFADLNGRTARVMATWSLYRDGFDVNRFFSLEEYYDQNPKAYYDALDSANEGDLTNWLEYFVYGLASEFEIVKQKIIRLSKDRNFKTKVGQVALNDRQIRIIDLIETNEEFTNQDFSKYFKDVSDDTILRDLKDLMSKKVIIKKGKTKAARYLLT
jgi:Fic family protein